MDINVSEPCNNSCSDFFSDHSFAACAEQHEKFSQFQREGEFCDVKICVQGQTFNCHRVILATMSDYFRTLFGGNSDGSWPAEVTLLNPVHSGPFRAILGYVYEFTTPKIDADNIGDLFDTAHFLGIQKIVALCEKYISRNIGNPSIDLYEILNRTFRCSAPLRRTVSQHILSNFKLFVRRDAFLSVPYDELSLLLQEYRSSCVPFKDEKFLSCAVRRWIDYASQERRQYSEVFAIILNCVVKSSEDGDLVPEKDGNHSADDSSTAPPRVKRIKLEEPSPHPENNAPTIHLFSEVENDTSYMFQIISLNDDKVQPEWFLSRQYYGEKKPEYHKVLVFTGFNDYFFCFKRPRGVDQDAVFHLHSSLDFPFEPPTMVLAGSPLTSCDNVSRTSQMRGFGTDTIYLYRGRYQMLPTGRAHAESFNDDELRLGMYCYNCSVNKWFPVPRMNHDVSYSRFITTANLIYLIGGRENARPASAGFTHQAYDPRSPNWLTLPRSSYPYNFRPYGDVANERIYVHNGEQMEAFDLAAGRWEIIDSDYKFIKNGESMMGLGQLISFNNKLYLVYADSGTRYFRIYDPSSEELSRVMPFYANRDKTPGSEYVPDNAVIFKPVDLS